MNHTILEQLIGVKNFPEMKKQIKSNIPMISNNGINVVDPEFIKNIDMIDPVTLANTILPNLDSSIFTSSLFYTHLKAAITYVTTELSQDFSVDKTLFVDYLSKIEDLGFELVAKVDKKSMSNIEEVAFLWNKEHSFMWEVSSFTRNNEKFVSSSYLFFQGVQRDPSVHHNMPISHSIAYNTNISIVDIQMHDFPIDKLTEILTKFTPVKNWVEFNMFSDSVQIAVDSFPTHVNDAIFSANFEKLDKNLSFKNEKQDLFLETVDLIIANMTKDEKLITIAVSRVYEYTSVKTEYASLPLKEALERHNIEDNLRSNYIHSINYKLCLDKTDKSFSPLDFFIDKGQLSDIKPMLEYLKKKKHNGLLSHFMEEDQFEKLEKRFT